jgi:hypothetical protein
MCQQEPMPSVNVASQGTQNKDQSLHRQALEWTTTNL